MQFYRFVGIGTVVQMRTPATDRWWIIPAFRRAWTIGSKVPSGRDAGCAKRRAGRADSKHWARAEPDRVFLIPRLRANLLVHWMGIRPAVTVDTWER